MIVAAEKGWSFDDTMKERGAVTSRLNAKNYKMLADNGVDVIDAEAHFVSNKVIEVVAGDDRQELTAVSYTHLDVYKRQGQGTPDSH